MAGKFINTSSIYQDMISQSSSITKSLMNNPYYLFSDKKGSVCDYYNLNTTRTTLDEATRGNYSEISAHSPLRFNKIMDFIIYGVTKIDPSMDIGEFGLESSGVSGEAIVLPRTIIPYPGDYFYLKQLQKPYLFRVTSVNPNTLETGATMYRIQYNLETSDGLKKIEPQVVRRFKFNLNTGGNGSEMGSNMSATIIDADEYNKSKALQEYTRILKDYFISLFYDPKIQSFSYVYDLTTEYKQNNGLPQKRFIVNMQEAKAPHPFGFRVYDPYLIEFMIRNKILSGSSNYFYVSQQMYLPPTFGMDYDKSIFASIENCDINKHYGRSVGNLFYCDQQFSLLYQYPEDYYYMQYHNLNALFHSISIFDDPGFSTRVINQEYYQDKVFKNLLIKFFNNIPITIEDVKQLDHLDYAQTREFFYGIPFGIYCIERQIANDLESSTYISSEVSEQ